MACAGQRWRRRPAKPKLACIVYGADVGRPRMAVEERAPMLLPRRSSVGAYLLAGGASVRMGRDKARLEIDGEAVVQRLSRALARVVCKVTLVAKRDQGFEDLGLPLLYDDTEERGLVHGLRAALVAPGPEWRFICACDMPHVGAQALARLWGAARILGAPGSCFQCRDRQVPEPLPSLWRADVGARVAPHWGMSARDWVRNAGLAIDVLDTTQSGMLANLNTPQAWHEDANPRERT